MSGGASSLIGGVIQLVGASKAQAAQKKAIKAQEKQASLADARERRKLLRQAQIAQGSATNVAASIGGLGSSGLIGGLSNVTNQAQSQIAYQNTSLQLAKEYNKYMQQAENISMWSKGIGNLIGGMDLGTISSGAPTSSQQPWTPPTWTFG